MEWMFMPLRRYADFSGRSRRKEYWLFTLFLVVVVTVLELWMFSTVAGAVEENGIVPPEEAAAMFPSVPAMRLALFWLATIIPTLAVTVRRYHDHDHRGWWMLVPIVNFIFLFIDGTRGPNRFGPDPKAEPPRRAAAPAA